jgi:hypothetical protein
VTGENERGQASGLDIDAQFLAQFADQRRFRPLAGLDLAAGELPKARERLARRPAGDQHPAVHIDQGGGDDQDDRRGGG